MLPASEIGQVSSPPAQRPPDELLRADALRIDMGDFAGGGQLTVNTVEDAAGFTALRPHWNVLLHASAADNPFLTWEWLHTWWVHLRESSALRLIVVRSGEEIRAIAPLRLITGAFPWFSSLEFLGTGLAGSDYLDLIVRRGHEDECLAAIARYLQKQQLAVRFTHLPPSSAAARLTALLAAHGWAATTDEDGMCPIIPLAGHTWESYLGTLGSSHRANVRRRIKALGQKFTVQFEAVTRDEDRHQLLARLADYSQQRWQGRGGSSAFRTAAMRAFQEELTRRALACGWLRLYVLRLDDRPVAVMYGFLYGGRFYFYQHGFDDQYRDHSLGLVLMGLTIRAAIEEGAREFDMLWGVEPYKFLWARDSAALQRIELFPMHFGGTVHRGAVHARRGARRLARRLLSFGASLGS